MQDWLMEGWPLHHVCQRVVFVRVLMNYEAPSTEVIGFIWPSRDSHAATEASHSPNCICLGNLSYCAVQPSSLHPHEVDRTASHFTCAMCGCLLLAAVDGLFLISVLATRSDA